MRITAAVSRYPRRSLARVAYVARVLFSPRDRRVICILIIHARLYNKRVYVYIPIIYALRYFFVFIILINFFPVNLRLNIIFLFL